MKIKFRMFILFVSIAGCVEPYDFVIRNQRPGISIEAYLSDKSFNDTRLYPSDGRYFTVKLSRNSDVTNVRSELITDAIVELTDDQGGTYAYTRPDDSEVFILTDADFSAKPGVKYKLLVRVEGEAEIQSTWETLPPAGSEIGDVQFDEVVRPMYQFEAGEQVVRDVRGVETFITVPPNDSGDPFYYRWSLEPMWVYVAPMASSISPIRKCWIRNPPYLKAYVLREDRAGDYDQPLFFMETIRNHRIYNEFSVLVKQEILSEDHYYFYKEMQDRNQGGFTQDTPPYNLKTNLEVITGDVDVFGYFAPVREEASRWYLLRPDLSYTVEDTALEDCLYPKVGPRAPQCLSCLEYEWGGEASNVKPDWWGGG